MVKGLYKGLSGNGTIKARDDKKLVALIKALDWMELQ